MTLDPTKLFVAVAAAFAIAWVICAAFVIVLPAGMMTLSGHMIHTELEGMNWSMNMAGFFTGLIAWSALAGAIAWVSAIIYNRMAG